MNTLAIQDDQRHIEEAPLLEPVPADSERCFRFAAKSHLARYIPELDPEHPRAKTLRTRMSKRTTVLKIQASLAFVVIVANCTFMAWAITSSPPDSQGKGLIFMGNCSSVSTANTCAHIVLNILSSLLLGAANYCMQILVAPSRREIDRAHSKGRILEIGVPSIHNLTRIDKRRTALWVAMGLVSSLLHLFWNSTIFESLPVASIPRAVVTNDFPSSTDDWNISYPNAPYMMLNIGTWDMSPVYDLRNQVHNFTRLDWRTCLDRYIDPFSATGSIIVIMRDFSSAQNNGSSLIQGWISSHDPVYWITAWMCSGYRDVIDSKYCTPDWSKTVGDTWVIKYGLQKYAVDYCLTGDGADNSQRCQLHYSVFVIGLVSVLGLIQASVIIWIWLETRNSQGIRIIHGPSKQNTMVTLGDAIANYLEVPDYSPTKAFDNVQLSNTSAMAEYRAKIWNPKQSSRWFSAISFKGWAVSMVLFSTAIGLGAYFLGSTVTHLKVYGVGISFSSIWQKGLKLDPAMVGWAADGIDRQSMRSSAAFLANILLANIGHIIVSFLYMFYNNILTRQLVADETLRFLQPEGKKPLRVSSPIGMQRSSYFLSLPFRYSIPLNVSMIFIHWLISQSIFLVQIIYFEPGSQTIRLPELDQSTIGISTLGNMLAVFFGFLMVIGLLVNSTARQYRKVPADFPARIFNSDTIRILCQRPEQDTDAHLFPIRLGTITTNAGLAQDGENSAMGESALLFTTDIDVGSPVSGQQYLQPVLPPEKSKFYTKGAALLWKSMRLSKHTKSV